MEEIATSLYYTFSTIAQVLASFLSLSAVFVIYQLQEYSKEQYKLCNSYIKNLQKAENESIEQKNARGENGNDNTIRKLSEFYIEFNENGLNSLIINELQSKHLGFLINSTSDNNKREIELSKRIETIEIKKNQLKKLTKLSVIVGIISICLSLLVIPNIPTISSRICLRVGISVFILIPTFLSIIIMGVGITNTLSTKKNLNK